MKSLATSWLFLALCVASGFAELNVTQTAEPGQVLDGLTQSLTINCSIWDDFNSTESNSTVTQALSMVIFLKPTGGNGSIEIATISSIKDPDTPTVTADGLSLKATATGHLETFGDDSYLTVHIDYPFKNATGDYSCKLVGMDDSYHVHEIEESDLVNFTSIKLPDAVKEIQAHDSRLTKLEMNMETLFTRLDSFKRAWRSFSFEVNQTEYLVSRPIMQNAALAESVCQLLGGYLLEVDTQAEFNFISERLTNKTVKYDVLVGLSNERVNGTWEFREHPGKTPYWTDNGRPGQSAAGDCGFLMHDQRWVLTGQPCYKNNVNMMFVCEIPKA